MYLARYRRRVRQPSRLRQSHNRRLPAHPASRFSPFLDDVCRSIGLPNASRFVYTRCFAHDLPEREPPALRSSAHCLLPLLTPVAATVSETSKSHHPCRSLAFYRYLKRLTQYVVVANCAFPHEHEQIAPRRVFHGLLAQRWRIQHHINCVAHLDRHVIARGVRGATSGSFMNFNLSDGAHLILRGGLAKSRKHRQKDKKQTH